MGAFARMGEGGSEAYLPPPPAGPRMKKSLISLCIYPFLFLLIYSYIVETAALFRYVNTISFWGSQVSRLAWRDYMYDFQFRLKNECYHIQNILY